MKNPQAGPLQGVAYMVKNLYRYSRFFDYREDCISGRDHEDLYPGWVIPDNPNFIDTVKYKDMMFKTPGRFGVTRIYE